MGDDGERGVKRTTRKSYLHDPEESRRLFKLNRHVLLNKLQLLFTNLHVSEKKKMGSSMKKSDARSGRHRNDDSGIFASPYPTYKTSFPTDDTKIEDAMEEEEEEVVAMDEDDLDDMNDLITSALSDAKRYGMDDEEDQDSVPIASLLECSLFKAVRKVHEIDIVKSIVGNRR